MTRDDFRAAAAQDLMLSSHELVRLIARAPHAYKVYTIAKKSGGLRTIAQPARETKVLQRWLMYKVFEKLPVHPCSTAYKTNSSIKDNARVHCGNSYISKFDFKDFFSSIMFDDLRRFLTEALEGKLSEADISDISRVSCIKYKGTTKLCLSVGAPSSPVLSNVIMYSFDTRVYDWCTERGVAYSRYADDLTFSTNVKGLAADLQPMLINLLRDLPYPNLRLNDKKTVHVSKKFQRRITGIVINNEGAISLGRERKREISVMIHKYSSQQLVRDDVFRLQGLLGFANDVEPSFIVSMSKKYGSAVITNIFSEKKAK